MHGQRNIKIYIKSLRNILNLNCITNNRIWRSCVTWQGTKYGVPEDDTWVSKYVEVWQFVN